MKNQINKKGVMGLDVAKAFVVGLLALILIGVVGMIVLVQMGDLNVIEGDPLSVTTRNETSAFINVSGYTLDNATLNEFSSPVIIAIQNGTDGTDIPIANATVTSAGVVTNATADNFPNVNISYTFSWRPTSDAENAISNGTSGLSEFFGNTTVWLSLLGVVIIILIISAVVAVVNRFGGDGSGGNPDMITT